MKTIPTAQDPGLAVVLVGSRGDSETYVRSKKKACEEIGIRSFGTDLKEDVTQEELLKVGTGSSGLLRLDKSDQHAHAFSFWANSYFKSLLHTRS